MQLMTQELHNKVVLSGMAIGIIVTPLIFMGLYVLFPQFAHELETTGRLELGIKCLIFPAVFFLVLVLRVGAQRFGNPSEDPTIVLAGTESMKVDLRVLSNTNEQIIIFTINTMSLAMLLPFKYLSILPIYSGLFVVGRLLFWLGYRRNALWRAPGFAMNILPAALGLLYCCMTLVALAV